MIVVDNYGQEDTAVQALFQMWKFQLSREAETTSAGGVDPGMWVGKARRGGWCTCNSESGLQRRWLLHVAPDPRNGPQLLLSVI